MSEACLIVCAQPRRTGWCQHENFGQSNISMSISATGDLTFTTLQRVMGGSSPISLSEYYSNASSGYTSGISGIPATGSAFSLSSLRGKNKIALNLQEFPPVALSSNSSVIAGQTYGNGTYNVWQSSVFSFASLPGYLAFTKRVGEDVWHSEINTYNVSGNYTGSSLFIAGYPGEWLKIQLPSPICLVRYDFVPRSGWLLRTPNTFLIYGSNDNSSWTMLDNQSGITGYVDATAKSFTINNTVAYSYYAVVINKTSGSDSVQIAEWKLFGYYLPKIWLRAEDIPTSIVHGQPVSSWPSVTNGITAAGYAAGTGSIPVIHRTTEPIPFVRMGTGTVSTTNGGYFDCGSQTFNVASNGGFSFAAVVRLREAGHWERIFDFGNGPNNDNILLGRYVTTSSFGFSYRNATAETVFSAGTITNGWDVMVGRIKADGMALLQDASTTQSSTPSLANKALLNTYIGKSAWSVDAYANMDMRELIIYDKALTDAEMLNVRTYLLHKYASPKVASYMVSNSVYEVGSSSVAPWSTTSQWTSYGGSSTAKWVTQESPSHMSGAAKFQYVYTSPIQQSVSITTLVDNTCVVYLNGANLGNGGSFGANAITIQGILQYGQNLIEIQAANSEGYGSGGLLFTMKDASGTLLLVSNGDWKTNQIVVTSNNYYSTLTRYTSKYAIAQAGANPDVQLQLSSASTTVSVTHVYGNMRLQDSDVVVVDFEMYVASTSQPADAMFFYMGLNTLPTAAYAEGAVSTAYQVLFEVYQYNGTYSRGVHLIKNGNVSAAASYPTSAHMVSAWVPVRIVYRKQTTNTFEIFLNGSSVITYNDSDVSSYVSGSGPYYGIGSRTGGWAVDMYIRRFNISLGAL